MTSATKDSSVEILLVEDNPGDVRLVQEALRESHVPSRLHVTKDGVEAMEFLRQRGKYADIPRPDILLLDLNMPKKTGIELLSEIRSDPELRSLPVVIVTSSQNRADIDKTLGLYANCYLIKPIDAERLILVLRTVKPDVGEIGNV
jgi:two-component system, chemotaxis family, response regulator Rcp1